MRKKGFLFLFICPFLIVSSQKWEVKIAKDNYFSINEIYQSNKQHQLTIEIENNNKYFLFQNNFINEKEASFPIDFQLNKGDSTFLFKEKFQILILIDKQKIIQKEYTYIPNPKGLYQLKPAKKSMAKLVKRKKEKIIDQYTWEDTLGKNIFIRTELITPTYKYLYFYHFLEKEEQYRLIQKSSDKQELPENKTKHQIESIQITDLNENNIAEISCLYYLNGKGKIILITNKQKYYLSHSAKRDVLFKASNNLNNEVEFKRFLIKKWQKEAS